MLSLGEAQLATHPRAKRGHQERGLVSRRSFPAVPARDSNSSIINPTKGGFMESMLLDAAGHRRSPATMPGYH